jgi:hypothetical protein
MSFWSRLTALFDPAGAPRASAEATFPCAICGEQAGAVAFVPKGVSHPQTAPMGPATNRIAVEGVTGALSQVISRHPRRVASAVEAADARALWQIDPLWAPFYCPDCGCSYCSQHWSTEVVFADDYPGWYEHTTGRCPEGHTRLLDD